MGRYISRSAHSERSPILDVDFVQSTSGKIDTTAASSAQALLPAFPVAHNGAAPLEAVDYGNSVDPESRRVSPAQGCAHFELIGFRVVRPESGVLGVVGQWSHPSLFR